MPKYPKDGPDYDPDGDRAKHRKVEYDEVQKVKVDPHGWIIINARDGIGKVELARLEWDRERGKIDEDGADLSDYDEP